MDDDNDAYIDVEWNLDVACFTNGSGVAYEDGVFLQLKADGVVIHTETIIQDEPAAVASSFRHETGPEASFTYQLNLYEIGPGSPPCAAPISDAGSTVAFIEPNITSITNEDAIEQIILNWEHTSKLPSRYILYRDDEVVANIDATDATTYQFVDAYKFNDANSIENGVEYNYCIETFSTITNQTYPTVCALGKTFDLALQATDDAFPNKVALTWASGISNYWDKLHLYRDNELIATLPVSMTNYIDANPIFGKKSIYGLEVVKNGVGLAKDEDMGSVPKNGKVAGKVLTLDNLFPVEGAKIMLSGTAGDSIVLDSVLTDFAGDFCFNEIYYDELTNFTVTASFLDNSFENNPQQFTLLNLKPAVTDLLFLKDGSYEIDEEDEMSVADFTLTSLVGADKVAISWTYTEMPDRATFFNLYRGSNLIAALNDENGTMTSFEDLEGEPNEIYTYRLVAFRFNPNGKMVQTTLQENVTFPTVTPPTGFSVMADVTNGYATLMWDAHSSSNFAGFFIYRNGQRIADLPTDATEYTDNYADPGSTVSYSVSAYRLVDEVNKESMWQTDTDVTFPALPAAESATATAQANQDKVELAWNIPASLTNSYNYTGFAIYRKESGAMEKTLIATKYKDFAAAGTTVTVTDYTGKPNQAYDYEICTFLATPDTTYHANAVMASATFPSVTPPTNLVATPHISRIALNWTAPVSNNLDGLSIFRNETDSLAAVNQQVTTIADEMPIRGVQYDYSVKAFRLVENQIYYSTPIEVNNVSTTTGDESPLIPEKFTASDDLPNMVKLCWEYPEFVLSIFELYKDGTLIATLPTTARAYYDYDGTAGVNARYQLKAIYNGNDASPAEVYGKKSCANRLNGRVYSSTKKMGVPFVRVLATGTEYEAYGITDATGYYEFTNLPNGNVTITVEGCNANWVNNNETITISCNQQFYTKDFINNYEIPAFETDKIAAPVQVKAVPNADLMDVSISWSPINNNYDGFEVYRGTKLLGTVAADVEMVWNDKDGAPAHSYGYQVRTFQDTENGRIYSDYVGDGNFFPRLQPVVYLTALPYPEKNAVRLQWAHQQSVDLAYVVERNGVVVATLENPERLEYIDETGLPGELYNYTVTAYYQNGTGLFASEEKSVEKVYPDIVKPQNINAIALSYGDWHGICDDITSSYPFNNQIEVSWEYLAGAADGFEIYRKANGISEALIAKVEGTERNYIDQSPLYGLECEYKITAIVQRNEQEFPSRNIKASLSIPQIVTPIQAIDFGESTENGYVKINFAYPFPGAEEVNVYRSNSSNVLGTLIETVQLPPESERGTNASDSPIFAVYDKDGLPGQTYFYQAIAKTNRSEVVHHSSSTLAGCEIIFPDVVNPTNVQASDNYNSFVEITWDYPVNAKADQFIVERGKPSSGSFIVTTSYLVDGTERSFREVFSGSNQILDATGLSSFYRVRAIRNTYEGPTDAHDESFPNVDQGAITESLTSILQQDLSNGAIASFGAKNLALSDNYLLMGRPDSRAIGLYKWEEAAWRSIRSDSKLKENFGYAVGLDYPYAIASWLGALDGSTDAGVPLYNISSETFDEIDIPAANDGSLWGFSVAITGTKMIVGGPLYDASNTNKGRAALLKLETGQVQVLSYIDGDDEEEARFGYDVAYDGVTILSGQPSIDADRPGKVFFHEFDDVSSNQAISASDGENNDAFGYSVDIDGDYAIVGAPFHGANDHGAAYIFEKNNAGTWEELVKIETGTTESNTGKSVAIKGNLAAVAIPYEANPTSVQAFVGKVKVYKMNNSGNWNYVAEFAGDVNELFGEALDISEDFLAVASPDNTYAFDLLNIPENVQATDGTFTNKSTITWDYTEIRDIDGFRIFRNGTEIGTVVGTSRTYDDTDGTAGVKVIYEVAAYTSDRDSQRAADEGYRLPNGTISGEVKTLIGQSPVDNVNITAEAIIDGISYSYQTTTDNTGAFEINNVFYGTGDGEYIITAQYEAHEFEPNPIQKTLNSSQATAGGLIIFDKTAYVVKGIVKHENMDCGIEGIEVKAISVSGATELVASTLTDDKGEYALAINPTLNGGLDEIRIEVANAQTFGDGQEAIDVNYHFDAAADNDDNNNDNIHVLDAIALAQIQPITTIDFIEKTTYEVAVKLANTCGQPVSSDLFDIRVRTNDGCLDFTTTLDVNGEATLQLPPVAGILINVIDVNVSSVTNLLVLDYLKYRPFRTDLETYHQENSTTVNGIGPDALLTYHKPPSINISPFARYMCPEDLASIAIVEQGEPYQHNVQVTENFNGADCSVTEGFVVVTNPGATQAKDTLLYDAANNKFEDYFFVADNPNLVFPHIWTLKFEYFAASGSFLGALEQPIVVEGEAAVPGNDVVVIPEEVPTPMYVLRDPPGDKSSSSITSGESVTKEISYKWSQGLSLKHKTKLDLGITAIGVSTNLEISGSQSAAIGNSYKIKMDFSETISTSNSAGKVGPNADIIVGAGVAYQYGIVEEIKVEPGCSNQINRFIKFGLSPNSVKTTFVQTVADIKRTVAIIDSSLVELAAIPETSRENNHDLTVERFETSKQNWESLLEYHTNQSVPLNYICSDPERFIEDITADLDFRYSNAEAFANPLLTERVHQEIEEWREAFCTFKTSKENGTDPLFLDDEMITAYNTFVNAVRILSNPLIMRDDIRAPEWYYDEDASDAPSTNLLNTDYENHPLANLFGKPAENITFGGGTSLTRNMNVGYSHANSFSFDLGASINFTIENKVESTIELVLGNGIMGILTGLSKASFSNSTSIGGSVKYHSDSKTSVTETTKVKYTLSDGETGDQHSVTILQGIENNHTPYFELIGGRTSCPPEPGTILRDRPNLDIIEGVGAVKETTAFNVPADEAATFNVKISNNSVLGEARSMTVFLDNQTNENGAIVRLAGQLMGEQTFFSVGPNQELVLPLTIERGLVAYQHETIQLKVKPFCTDGNKKWPDSLSSPITFSVFFQNPCSPISIVMPGNDWVINGQDDNLVIGLRDYQTDNAIFEALNLQYRRTDTGDDWDDLPGRHVIVDLSNDPLADPCEPVPYPVSKQCLATYNNQFFAPGQTPTFFMVWDFPDDFTTYPDGDYEIRAVAACGTNGVTYSNVISGRIDRSNIRLFGQPEPKDGLWIPGDEISADFNKNLDCSLFDDADFVDTSFFLYHKPSGSGEVDLSTLTRVNATVACLNNELIFEAMQPMSDFDGDSLIAVLANVTDLSKNISDTIRWEFKVITSKLYWGEEEILVELYKGEQITVGVPLLSTEIVAPVDNAQLSRTGASNSWLNFSPNGTFSVNPNGKVIAFTISGNTIGNFEETIFVNADGLSEPLPINIKAVVRAEAPDWEVNTADYSQTMVMVANYRFTDEEADALSKDSLDMVSVWIDNEIRGVGRIEKAGMFYAAYLVIYGNPQDYGHPLEFRVWKATEGIDYDAFPSEEIIYDGGSTKGSTANPEILTIDRNKDKAYYLKLNQGWTYFSINRQDANDDMSLDNMFKQLKNVSPADEILTQDKFAEYVDGQGWITAGSTTLNDIDVHESYRIYLENGPDELRMTGKDATFQNIETNEGWNWIGYPRQATAPINDVLNFLSTPSNGDEIYTIPQNGGVQLANYNNSTGWSGNLANLTPFVGYKLRLNSDNTLTYPGNAALSNPSIIEWRNSNLADPTDETTWNMEGYDLEYVTTLITELTVNNEISTDTNDKLAAFIGDELRGVANIQYIPEVDKYYAVMVIGTLAPNEELEMFLYDASIGNILPIQETVLTKQDAGYGTFTEPLPLTAAIFKVEITKEDVLCDADQTGRAEVVVNEGLPPYTYLWNTGSTNSSIENVGAGQYSVVIRDIRNIPVQIDIEILDLDTDIPAPNLSPSLTSACQGATVNLSASNTTFPDAEYFWYENSELIHTGSDFAVNNLQGDRVFNVTTLVNGCPSELSTANVFLDAWVDATFTANVRTPALGQPVTFTPNEQRPGATYHWSFGDGTTSTEMIPQHTYYTEGRFDVSLTTNTPGGCGFSNISNDYIVTDGSPIDCTGDPDTDMDNHPNPCDNCPTLANMSQSDQDADGRGDACDCNPTLANDHNIFLGGDLTGLYEANFTVVANGTIVSGGGHTLDAEFKASEFIELQPGFEVPLGRSFLAQIGICETAELAEEETAERTLEEDKMESLTLKIVPNPVVGNANIQYELPQAAKVSLSIHQVTGEMVRELMTAEQQVEGYYQVLFLTDNLAAGMYYVHLRIGEKMVVEKMVILE